eukprot:gene9411-biopygen21221
MAPRGKTNICGATGAASGERRATGEESERRRRCHCHKTIQNEVRAVLCWWIGLVQFCLVRQRRREIFEMRLAVVVGERAKDTGVAISDRFPVRKRPTLFLSKGGVTRLSLAPGLGGDAVIGAAASLPQGGGGIALHTSAATQSQPTSRLPQQAPNSTRFRLH